MTPLSPTLVFMPSGNLCINDNALACRAASVICSDVTVSGSRAPYAMFSAIDVENKAGS